MEKLIKLVCEYDRFKEGKHMDRCITNGDFDNKFYRLYIVSKEYGFIKRLLDKDKININKYRDDFEETNLYCDSDFFQLQKHYSVYESLLMTLSIKDDPIKFLSEILKDE